MSGQERPARSIEEARLADVEQAEESERPPPETTPEPPETLDEQAHWCLSCTDPGVVQDALGIWHCQRHDQERSARMRRLEQQRNRRDRSPEDETAVRAAAREELDQQLDRMRRRAPTGPAVEERLPYRDEPGDF